MRDLERRVAALEGADAALATATGVAAIAATFLSLLKSGDHLVISDVAYAGAYELATRILPGFGIEVTPVNLSRPDDLRAAMRPNTRLVHAETPCNPILRLTDLKAVSEIAHQGGAILSVDSPLATPVVTRPLEHGADLVLLHGKMPLLCTAELLLAPGCRPAGFHADAFYDVTNSYNLFLMPARRPMLEAHHLVLGLSTAVLLTAVITNMIKCPVGRLRPDFNAR